MSEQLAIDFEQAAVENAPTLESLVGDLTDAGGAIARAFRCMEWAEDAIEKAKAAYPVRAALIDRAFLVLKPRAGLLERGFGEVVVRSHMDELLRRVGEAGEAADLVTATAAEACTAYAEVSNAAPFKHQYTVAYQATFVDAFGEERAAGVIGEEAVRRAQDDRTSSHLIADAIRDVRHEMRDEERGKQWKEIVQQVKALEQAA